MVPHGKPGQEYPVDVTFEQGWRTPPPVRGHHHEVLAPPIHVLLLYDVGLKGLRTVIPAA
jgi:hypothetical protein